MNPPQDDRTTPQKITGIDPAPNRLTPVDHYRIEITETGIDEARHLLQHATAHPDTADRCIEQALDHLSKAANAVGAFVISHSHEDEERQEAYLGVAMTDDDDDDDDDDEDPRDVL